MGFFDALFGRTRLPSGKIDQLFGLATGILDVEVKLDSHFAGVAGLVLRTVDNSGFEHVERDIRESLELGGRDMAITLSSAEDAMGFHWLVLRGKDIDDVINGLHLAADLVKETGYGDSLLAAMFRFDPGWFLIYNYRRAAFYPFVPAGRSKSRDSAREFRISEALKSAMVIEKDPERRYALWDPPF